MGRTTITVFIELLLLKWVVKKFEKITRWNLKLQGVDLLQCLDLPRRGILHRFHFSKLSCPYYGQENQGKWERWVESMVACVTRIPEKVVLDLNNEIYK